MASKLEKAQTEYENLLRELGHRAEMVGMYDKADPELLKVYERSKESVEDRKLELELLESEIERIGEERDHLIADMERELAELQASAKTTGRKIDAKKHKLGPAKKNLAGAEYDMKFAERALQDELKKRKKAEEIEDFAKAGQHDVFIKRMKIDLLKRQKKLLDLKRQVKEYENPAASLKGDAEQLQGRIKELKTELAAAKKAGEDEVIDDLKRQKKEKQKDIQRSEQHVLDTMADVGEDLYEKRAPHSVLEKYYVDIDRVAREIDELQELEGKG